MSVSRALALAVCVAAAAPAIGASWEDAGWRIEAKQWKTERYLGRDSLLLDSGTAWLDNAAFQDGVIELDVAASADFGFHGIAFRAQDHDNYEHFYLRSHLSGKPDATQYTPVYNGDSGWQIYASPRFAQPAEIVPDRWVHVRMVVRGTRLEASVDGKTLVFPQLLRPSNAGGIGLTASLSAAHFANVVIRRGDTPAPEGGEGAPPQPVPAGSVANWRVSTAFAEKRLDSLEALNPRHWQDLKWEELAASVVGIANLAMLRAGDKDRNTVFAAVTLHANDAKPVLMRFGFSDRVRVYLNGRPLYRGNDRFQSRDYRFLGTVGLFDELILPLKRGDNALWFAVSEDFGGWAVTAQLP
jgi:hypothetical protein